jgi:hypothetical protein
MSLFKRRTSGREDQEETLIPSGLVARLEPFGRFEFDPQGSGVDAIGHPNDEYLLLQTAKQDPDRFLAALASATVPIGGWTVYGAMRLLWHFGLLKPERSGSDGDAIGIAALRFIRDAGARWEQLNADEVALWNRAAGQPW